MIEQQQLNPAPTGAFATSKFKYLNFYVHKNMASDRRPERATLEITSIFAT